MNSLYTFIMDYLGGTYISQVSALSKEDAMQLWMANLKIDEIEEFSEEDKERLIKENFSDEEPIPVTTMENVWFIGVRTSKGYGSVHFVKTHHS